MAFGKITKEDLIAAGLDPDKLVEFQSKGVTKDDLTAMSTALETKLTTTVTDLIKNSFAELEGKLKPVMPTNNNNTNDNTEFDENQEFMSDPVGYVKKQQSKIAISASVEFKKLSRELAWKEGLRTLKGLSNSALRAEIEEEWMKYTPEKMTQYGTDPTICLQQIHDMILGKHHDEIVQDNNKRDGKFNLVHSGTGSGSGNMGVVSNTDNTNKTVLTDAEKVTARKFGMTEEEWIKQGEDMEKEEVDRRAGMLVGGKS